MNYHLNNTELDTIVSALYLEYRRTHDVQIKHLYNKMYDLYVHSDSQDFNIEEILP